MMIFNRFKSPQQNDHVTVRGLWLFLVLIVVCIFIGRSVLLAGTNYFVWNTSDNTVQAEIDGWPLHRVLEHVAAQTRWQILVEPGLDRVVTAKFRDLKPGEAMRKLLGDLSFVMLPSTNGPGRLYVFRTSVQTATSMITAPPIARGPRLIPDELIVRLKPTATNSADEFAKKLGANVIGSIDSLRVFRLKFPDEESAKKARETIANEDSVGDIESNYATPRPDNHAFLGLESVVPSFTIRPARNRNKVIVALLDTAVQTEGTVLGDFLLPSVSVAGESWTPSDMPSHGSSMATAILWALERTSAGNPETPVRILPVDIYGPNEVTTTFDIANGIVAAMANGASIINLSLGGTSDSPLIHSLIRAARERGVLFTAAAGNEPTSIPTFPAAYPEVIAVTALNSRGEIAPYANRGDFVDVAAPGISLVPFAGQVYVVTGTSTATAHVSAIAAALMASGIQDPAVVEGLIRQNLALGVLVPKP